jgi:hypothetical protein
MRRRGSGECTLSAALKLQQLLLQAAVEMCGVTAQLQQL